MATLLVITVLLPVMGSLVLVLLPKLEFQRARSIALAIRACDSGIQPDLAARVSTRT